MQFQIFRWLLSRRLAPVGIAGGSKVGYIDTANKLVIQPQYDYADSFNEGVALVEVGDKIGYIDRTGKYIWEPTN